MRNKQQKEAEPQAQPSHPSREEGLYYEKVFAPQKVEVFWNDKTKALTKLMFKDKNGQALEVAERRLVSRVLMYFAPYTDFGKISELRALEPNLLQKALNLAIKKRGKDLKALYDDKGCLEGVASTLHEQISWKKVKEIVESAIRKVTGGQVITPEDTDHAFKWNYRVPVKDNNVSSWVGVNAGNNIIKGRSGIRIFSRFRTEKEDSKGGVKRPACLNWCGMWQFPQQ